MNLNADAETDLRNACVMAAIRHGFQVTLQNVRLSPGEIPGFPGEQEHPYPVVSWF